MTVIKKHLQLYTIPIILFLCVFSLYIYTAPPGVTNYADSSELITASYILGVPHPPGYPIFVLVGKLFSFLPIGEVAFRYAMMSSVLGAVTVVLVYMALALLLGRGEKVGIAIHNISKKEYQAKIVYTIIPALMASLGLAFSYLFWLYSIVPEVWAFNSFFVALLLYLGICWHYSKNEAYLIVIAASFSLAFLAQQVIVFLIPAFLYLVWITDKNVFIPTKRWIKLLVAFAAGLLPLLYFPLASLNRFVAIDFGNVRSLTSLWELLSRHYYAQNDANGHAYLQSDFRIEDRIQELLNYPGIVNENFTFPIFLLGLMGAGTLCMLLARKKLRDIYYFPGIAFLCGGIIFVMYASPDFSELNFSYTFFGVHERMYIMGMVLFAFLVGIGVEALLRLVKIQKHIRSLLFGGLLLLLPVYPFIAHEANVNKSNFYLGEDYAYNLFVNLEPNAILFVWGDMPSFAAFYYQEVQEERPDVIIVPVATFPVWRQQSYIKKYPGLWNLESTQPTLIFRDIIVDNIDKRPIYFTAIEIDEINEFGLRENPYVLSPRGIVYKVTKTFEPGDEKKLWGNMRWRNSDRVDDHYDWFAKETIEQYLIGHFNSFSWYERYGYYDRAMVHVQEIQKKDPLYIGLQIVSVRLGEGSRQGFEEKDPKRTEAELVKEAFEFIRQAKFNAAFGDFAYLVDLYPENVSYRYQLALLYETLGMSKEAIQEFQTILQMDPDNREVIEIVERQKLLK